MKSKKIIAVILALVAALSFSFAACSDESNTEITTDDAVIKSGDAVDLIKSYSTEQLGLPGSWEDYGFVGYNRYGVKVEDGSHDGYYVEVRVGNKNDNGDGTLTFDIAGYYLISYDGETILKYDPAKETYTPLSEVQQESSSAAPEVSDSETQSASAEN